MRDFRVLNATMPTATTLGSAVDLGAGFNRVYLQLPTMATATLIRVYSAESLNGTYMPVFNRALVTSTAEIPRQYGLITAACAGVHPIPEGLRFVKLELATMVSNNATAFRFLVSDF
jgi:hypothetical protein